MYVKKRYLGFWLLALAGLDARADVLYDSLTASTAASAGFNLVNAADFGPLADSISTGGAAFALTDVQLALTNTDPSSTGTVTVYLLSDSATSLGAVLANLGAVSDSVLSSYTPATVDFPQSQAIELAANTRYWIEVSGSSDSNAGWSYTADTSGVGVAGEYNANSFQVYANSGDPSLNLINDPYQLQVNGVSAVPLPGGASLFVSALGVLGLAGRRSFANSNGRKG